MKEYEKGDRVSITLSERDAESLTLYQQRHLHMSEQDLFRNLLEFDRIEKEDGQSRGAMVKRLYTITHMILYVLWFKMGSDRDQPITAIKDEVDRFIEFFHTATNGNHP